MSDLMPGCLWEHNKVVGRREKQPPLVQDYAEAHEQLSMLGTGLEPGPADLTAPPVSTLSAYFDNASEVLSSLSLVLNQQAHLCTYLPCLLRSQQTQW